MTASARDTACSDAVIVVRALNIKASLDRAGLNGIFNFDFFGVGVMKVTGRSVCASSWTT